MLENESRPGQGAATSEGSINSFEVTLLNDRTQATRRMRARFVIDAAREAGVELSVVQGERGPRVLAWAPGASTPQHQLDCERSFEIAIASLWRCA